MVYAIAAVTWSGSSQESLALFAVRWMTSLVYKKVGTRCKVLNDHDRAAYRFKSFSISYPTETSPNSKRTQ